MRHWCTFNKIVVLLLLITLLIASQSLPVFAATDKTASETVRDMGIGWNLGNTLEACGDWINGKKVQDYETAWGAVVTTQAIIDGVKAAGFNSVRIPVAWSNLIGTDYTINQDLLKRVKEVVDYCSNADMYAIVNIHWDNGWFANFATNYDESMKKYTAIWTQISNCFNDYPSNLILESLNEEGCWDSIWNRWSGTTGDAKTRAYNILNNINQKFVDIVRASGGNNASRCLLIAGYATDIDLTCDPSFLMPKDTVSNKLIISVHYYTPSTFTILTEDASWGKCATTWGTDAEINQVKTDFQKMKNKFANNGVPVIIGEYGTVTQNKDPESVRCYLSTICKTAYDLGFCPLLWDASEHYSRTDRKIKDTELAEFYLQYKTTGPINTPSPTITNTEDINGDKVINMVDIVLIAAHFNTTVSESNYDRKCDLNNDGAINMGDVVMVALKFNMILQN